MATKKTPAPKTPQELVALGAARRAASDAKAKAAPKTPAEIVAFARKGATKGATKPAAGICHHRNVAKQYDCKLPSRVATPTRKAGSWCDKHVLAGRAAAKKPAPKAKVTKAPKLTILRPVANPDGSVNVGAPEGLTSIAALVTLAPTDEPS